MTPDATPVTRADLDRAVESIANDFSELRQELRRLLEPLSIRLETMGNRLDNQLPILLSVDQRVSALVRQHDRLEREGGEMLLNDAAQRTAIDQIVARLTKLEREIHPEKQ